MTAGAARHVALQHPTGSPPTEALATGSSLHVKPQHGTVHGSEQRRSAGMCTSLPNWRSVKAASYSAGCSYSLRVSSSVCRSSSTISDAKRGRCATAAVEGSLAVDVGAAALRHTCRAPDRSTRAPHPKLRTPSCIVDIDCKQRVPSSTGRYLSRCHQEQRMATTC